MEHVLRRVCTRSPLLFSTSIHAGSWNRLLSIPAERRLRQADRRCASDVRENPDWTTTWRLIEDKWDQGDVCIDGALDPFHIDAKLNGGTVASDCSNGKEIRETLEVSTRSGQDSDCNPRAPAGILGVMLGMSASDTFGRPAIPAHRRYAHARVHTVLLNQIVASTQARVLKVVEEAGARYPHGNRNTGPGTSSAPY